ncbi:hypothetical protein [Nonomuraea roseoviolacea]|uniref:hypothetical protein n=1 Tax=Nonomuraea roseoviolacea TaxID=103837 RepID=UPI0031E3C280
MSRNPTTPIGNRPNQPKRDARIDAKFRQWAVVSAKATEFKGRADQLRPELLAYAENHGEEDAKGHREVDLEEPFEVPGGETYTGFTREVRRSRRVNEERTWEMAEEKDLLDQIFPEQTIRVFSEEGLYAAYQEDKITDEELDSLIDVSETYALRTRSS